MLTVYEAGRIPRFATPGRQLHKQMNSFLVNCINKSVSTGSHEHITHIGNATNSWRMTKEEAIRRINSQEASFHTLERGTGKQMPIGVVRPPGGTPYLRTHADGVWNDNLLAQTTCGSNCTLKG